IGLALVTLEGSWFRWFLSEPLPNAQPNASRAGAEKLNRSVLLWQALPGVVPRLPANKAVLVLAARELSHVENLPHAIPIAAPAAFMAAAAVALGLLTLRALGLRRCTEARGHLSLAFGLGTVGLGLIALAIGRLGLLSPWPIRIGLGLPIAAEVALQV